MKAWQWLAAGMLAFAATALAGVPELEKLVPGATGYELIARFNPLTWSAKGYQVDRSENLSGKITRVGYLMVLTGKDGKQNWAFAAMAPFAQDFGALGVPADNNLQAKVSDLEVFSNVEGVKTGKFPEGNIEFFHTNYGPKNEAKIPGASDSAFDFGDIAAPEHGYGCMQIHNFAEKQTVMAFNGISQQLANIDLGIGNCAGKNPDWTFAKNGGTFQNAEIFVVAKVDDLKTVDTVVLDPKKIALIGVTDKDPLKYAPGEKMTFTLTLKNSGAKPTKQYFIRWNRSGDDGKNEKGKEEWTEGKPLTITTSLDKPGFVYIHAEVVDKFGKAVTLPGPRDKFQFNGGAAVEPEKIVAAPCPGDFKAFWDKQRERLTAMPLKLDEVKKEKISTGKNAEIFKVAIPCPGPRPATGYLTIPLNAKAKSLPAQIWFHGYGFRGVTDNPPKDGAGNKITLTINAHGYELMKDKAYYDAFGAAIRTKSGGRDWSYAWDPAVNADREKTYFNGMVMRVLRSLQYLKALPEWNGKDLWASGGSQGGLQTIWAAALDPDVTKAEPSIPWGCDYGGKENFKRNAGGWRVPFAAGLPYYDTCNMATLIKCPVNVTRAGLGDYVCPPSGVAIFYNTLTCPKSITWVQGSTHGYVPAEPDKQEITITAPAAK